MKEKLNYKNITGLNRSIYLSMISILCCFAISSCQTKEKKNDPDLQLSSAIPVIFDTDIQGDYDDVGALAMIHAFADSGDIQLLATIGSNRSPLVVPTIEVINTYFDRPEIPIGVVKGSGVEQDSRELHWPDSLMVNFPHTYSSNDQAPDAVEVYRKILAQQPDSSVTIITVGFLTNLKDLLLSKADSLSPLNGKDLVAQKVKHWVAMAGSFPEGKETNVRRDSLSSVYVIENWPTPVIFSGFEIGVEVKTGLRLIKEGEINNPVRMAYAISIPKRPYDREGRRSWDQTAVLAAVRESDSYFDYQSGKFIAKPDGSNAWQDDPNGLHKYLKMKMPADSLAYIIENLMMHHPFN